MTKKQIAGSDELLDNTLLWHYTTFSALEAILNSKQWRMTRVSEFEDTLEGTAPINEQWSLSLNFCDGEYLKRDAKDVEALLNSLDVARRRVFASSWHINDHENILMWKAYAPDSRGIAIRTTVGALKRAFDGQELEFRSVKYWDYAADMIEAGNPVDYAACKNRPYQPEVEYRALKIYDSPVDSTHEGVCIQPDKLICDLTISPFADSHDRNRVQRLLEAHGLESIKVRYSCCRSRS